MIVYHEKKRSNGSALLNYFKIRSHKNKLKYYNQIKLEDDLQSKVSLYESNKNKYNIDKQLEKI